MKKCLKNLFLLICMFSLFAGTVGTASATNISVAAQNRASDYLDSYEAWTSSGAKREVIISFNVYATDYMDFIGSTYIVVQEKNGSSWDTVMTRFGSVANGLLEEDTDEHAGNISYMGTSGKEYRALVTIYAENNKGNDSRTIITNSVTAQ